MEFFGELFQWAAQQYSAGQKPVLGISVTSTQSFWRFEGERRVLDVMSSNASGTIAYTPPEILFDPRPVPMPRLFPAQFAGNVEMVPQAGNPPPVGDVSLSIQIIDAAILYQGNGGQFSPAPSEYQVLATSQQDNATDPFFTLQTQDDVPELGTLAAPVGLLTFTGVGIPGQPLPGPGQVAGPGESTTVYLYAPAGD